ncbi:MAG: CsgG/HfaB family protein [Porticoccaceae bacterium]|jgi:curli biogenesis system outer membrane secretion channel CsgG
MMKKTTAALLISMLVAAPGVNATEPVKGGASDMSVTGGVGGANSQGGAGDLEYCPETLGTLAVEEDQQAHWYSIYYSRYPQLGSTVPVLRMMIQQSNCFVVVERGRAMNNLMQERALEDSGELRSGSNFGRGQMVSADYTMSPSIQFSEKGTGGIGGAIGGFFGDKGRLIGGLAGGLKKNEAATTLLLIDNRSSVQISAAVGSAKNMDFSLGGAVFGGSGGGAAGGFTNTPEGKVIIAAFADSYNQMIRALRNYRAQTVEGGLGKGGRLGVGE